MLIDNNGTSESQSRYLGILISENGYRTKEIRSRIEMTKKVFMERRKLSTGKMNNGTKEEINEMISLG